MPGQWAVFPSVGLGFQFFYWLVHHPQDLVQLTFGVDILASSSPPNEIAREHT